MRNNLLIRKQLLFYFRIQTFNFNHHVLMLFFNFHVQYFYRNVYSYICTKMLQYKEVYFNKMRIEICIYKMFVFIYF